MNLAVAHTSAGAAYDAPVSRAIGAAVANLGDVLTALGQVAVTVDRAGVAVGGAGTALDSAGAALAEAVAGSNDREVGQALEHMTVAINTTRDVDQLLRAIAGKVSAVVERLVNPDGNPVLPGARAARAPVAGRTHPTHTPVPPPRERDHEWAARIGGQLALWEVGGRTEALVFDTEGNDWQVNSGVESQLTAAASAVIEEMISAGEVGTSPDLSGNQSERTWLRQAKTHAEAKAAVWAAANGKRFVDVVTNRDIVCGETYQPGTRQYPPGCAQVVAAIGLSGYLAGRVQDAGVAARGGRPLIIIGRGKKG